MSETDTQETWRKIIRDEPWQLSGPQAGWVYLQVGNTGYPMPEALVDVILADHDERAEVEQGTWRKEPEYTQSLDPKYHRYRLVTDVRYYGDHGDLVVLRSLPLALADRILADHDELARVKAELRQVTDERGVAWNYKTGIEIAKGREHLAHRYDGNFHDDCVYCVFARGHGKTTGMPELDSYLATIADLRSQLEAVQTERDRYKTALEEIKTLPHWNDRSVDAAIHIAAEALRTPPA